jgi:hypothetical protein
MGLSTFDEFLPISQRTLIKAAQTTAIQQIAVSVNGSLRIDNVLVSNNDVIAHVVDLVVSSGVTPTIIGGASVPAGTGYAGTKSIDLLATALPATLVGLVLPLGTGLYANAEVAVTSTFELDLTVLGGVV